MAVYLFASTDADAPRLSGTAGDLTNFLDKVLVDGYNTKTITITRSGTTATANCTSHGFVTNQRVAVSGADQADYNIETRITVTDANNFTYTVANSPTTPATGTISAKIAPLGWSIAYTATNKRAYRQKTGTNQFYLRVTDDGTGSALYGRLVGYETMTDIDTGTGPFPTAAQVSGGMSAKKSDTASTTGRSWFMHSDGKHFNVAVNTNGAGTQWHAFAFGDFVSLVDGSSDYYNTYISANPGTGNGQAANPWRTAGISSTMSSTGWYAPRIAAGTGTAIPLGMTVPSCVSGYLGGNNNGSNLYYPSSYSGGMLLSRVYIYDGETDGGRRGPRGWLPGVWGPLHTSLTPGDTFSGATGTPLEGRSFVIRAGADNNTVSICTPVIETSDTWGTF